MRVVLEKRERGDKIIYTYIYIYICIYIFFTSYEQLVLTGPAQMFWRPKAESSNGVFLLSFKQYLTSILYNNFFLKSILFTI